jgi:hypothetical protein
MSHEMTPIPGAEITPMQIEFYLFNKQARINLDILKKELTDHVNAEIARLEETLKNETNNTMLMPIFNVLHDQHASERPKDRPYC